MKHKFSGEICVYCNIAPADTSDHALGRKFFLEERRDKLPQVPACKRCNNRKSELEGYLMTVLPFGAKNADAAKILTKLVPPPDLRRTRSSSGRCGKGTTVAVARLFLSITRNWRNCSQ